MVRKTIRNGPRTIRDHLMKVLSIKKLSIKIFIHNFFIDKNLIDRIRSIKNFADNNVIDENLINKNISMTIFILLTIRTVDAKLSDIDHLLSSFTFGKLDRFDQVNHQFGAGH